MVRIKLDYATVHKNSNVYLQGKKKNYECPALQYNRQDGHIHNMCRKKERQKERFLSLQAVRLPLALSIVSPSSAGVIFSTMP